MLSQHILKNQTEQQQRFELRRRAGGGSTASLLLVSPRIIMTYDVRGREGVVPLHSRRQRQSYGGGGVWGGWSIFAGTEIKATFTFVGNV